MEQFLEIFAGYYAVQLICAVFVYGVGEFLPHALPVMKYVGAAYILWLALLSQALPDHQHRAGPDFAGMHLEYAVRVTFVWSWTEERTCGTL